MIDFDKAFPTKDEFKELDTSNEIQAETEKLKRRFLSFYEAAPSKKEYIEHEIKDCEAYRDNIAPPQKVCFIDGVELYSCFQNGWKSAISGGDTVLNNVYKFSPSIKTQIEQKYTNDNLPENYFQRLSKVAMEEWIRGNATYRFYVWLKNPDFNDVNTKKKTDRLRIELLEEYEPIYDYYDRNYKWMYNNVNDEYKDIPMPEPVSLEIEKNGLKFPFKNYAKGFTEQYKKGLPIKEYHTKEDIKNIVFDNIQPNYYLPPISHKTDTNKTQYYDEGKIYEYGKRMASSFLAWEQVIECPSVFVDVFVPKDPNTEERQRVRHRLFLLKHFTQFPDCTIKLYKDNNKALSIISTDLEQLRAASERYEAYLLKSDVLKTEIASASTVTLDCFEMFYSKLRDFEKIENESFFISEEIDWLTRYSVGVSDEFPVLRYWLRYLTDKQKAIESGFKKGENEENNTEITYKRLSIINNQKIIALVHFYLHEAYPLQGWDITRENCSDVALYHGYNRPNSGKSLLDDWVSFEKNRIGTDMVQKIGKAIKYLEKYPEAKKLADKDLQESKNAKKKNTLVQKKC
jgi:hypothetical protein